MRGGAVPHTVQASRGSPPGQPRWARLKLILVSGENPSVCGSCLGCVVWGCAAAGETPKLYLLVIIGKIPFWLQGQWVLQVLEGEILVLLWAVCV